VSPSPATARPHMRRHLAPPALACALAASLAAAPSACAAASPSEPSPPALSGVVTLDQARATALAHHPSLQGARLGVEAAAASARDAVRRPPFRIEAEAENWGMNGGPPTLESTASIGWTLELGGDRAARRTAAGAALTLAHAEAGLARLDVGATVTTAFADAWEAQERHAALGEAAADAAVAVEAARERLRAGASPAVEVARAESDAARARAELARAAAERDAARRALAATWGDESVGFDSLALDAPDVPPTPAAGVPAAHPVLARGEAARHVAEAEAGLARASRVPDLEVRLGARRFHAEGSTGLVAAVAMPLGAGGPGAIEAARAHAARTALQQRTEGRTLRTEARTAGIVLEGTLAAWRELSNTAAPRAGEALALLTAGYRAGRYGYVDLVEGRRAALESRLAVIAAAADAWRARAELERWTGGDGEPRGEEGR